MNRRQKALVVALIVGAHAAVLAAFVLVRISRPEPARHTLAVSFVAEQQDQPEEAPPQPPPPAPKPPTPAPRMIATSKPTESPVTAQPMEEAAVQEAAPEAPPSPPAAAGPASPAVTPPDFSADYLNNPGPKYPLASRRRREEGLVMLKVLVSADGSSAQVIVDKSSGYAELDKAAADVVKSRWRFVPAKEGNQPVEAWVAIPISFSLKSN